MLTIKILPLFSGPVDLDTGAHMVDPTFNLFLNTLAQVVESDETELYIHSMPDSQFITMPRWAMAEKIGELSGYGVMQQDNGDIVILDKA